MSDPVHVVCPHCTAKNRVPRDRLGERPVCGGCKNALFTARPLELTGATFERHIAASEIPVVVDFWAPWCGPCRMMAPHFERAAGELEPLVRLAKLNTEAEQELATRFGIRSIPTLVAFRDGREIARQSGAMDTAGLTRWVKGALA
jgi:thioredoxin 2